MIEAIYTIIIVTGIEAAIIAGICDDLSVFNPMRNYKKWKSMNWFGVIFFTLLLNVAMPILAFFYWFYKVCTVGRKST